MLPENNTPLATVFQDSLGKPVPACQTIMDFAAAADDGGGGCNAPFTSTSPEYQHSVSYRPDALPAA